MLENVTPLILTYNEAPNIGRTLSMLTWARDIVVVDSVSSDATVEIAKSFPQVRVFQRPFDLLATQWNYALKETGISSEWVLALDADYILTPGLVDEIGALQPPADVFGYVTQFDYCIYGKPLRNNTYGVVPTLYRRAHAHYEQDGHAQRVRLPGTLGTLQGRIRHDDRKSLAQWCEAQNKYMAQEAAKLTGLPASELGLADRIRRMIFVAPPLMFLYCAFVKGNILDGKEGLFYVWQRTVAELLLSLHLLELRLRREARERSE